MAGVRSRCWYPPSRKTRPAARRQWVPPRRTFQTTCTVRLPQHYRCVSRARGLSRGFVLHLTVQQLNNLRGHSVRFQSYPAQHDPSSFRFEDSYAQRRPHARRR